MEGSRQPAVAGPGPHQRVRAALPARAPVSPPPLHTRQCGDCPEADGCPLPVDAAVQGSNDRHWLGGGRDQQDSGGHLVHFTVGTLRPRAEAGRKGSPCIRHRLGLPRGASCRSTQGPCQGGVFVPDFTDAKTEARRYSETEGH